MTVDEPRREHFRPDHDQYTQFVCVGPKFLASVFVTDPSGDEHRRRRRFARRLLRSIRDRELPYTRVVVTDHVVDEAATRLKKKHRHADAVDCLERIRESDIVEIRSVSRTEFDAACEAFVAFDDHDGVMTDFLTKSFVEAAELSYVATWDSHYRAFDNLSLLPNCDH